MFYCSSFISIFDGDQYIVKMAEFNQFDLRQFNVFEGFFKIKY